METIRSVLSVAAKNNMSLAQFDVSTAFLYGELDDKEIYMQQPEGYEQGQGFVRGLKKSLRAKTSAKMLAKALRSLPAESRFQSYPGGSMSSYQGKKWQ